MTQSGGDSSGNGTATALRMTDVRRSYPGTQPVEALRGIDISVAGGEFLAITGVSGSGKSTLLNIIGMLDRPTSGDYRIDGTPTSSLGERQRDQLRGTTFGFVFQASHMLADRTVGANVALPLQIQGVRHRHRASLVREALSAVGMTHRVGALAVSLSGGERQRAAIARAIVGSPRVVLADEPTGNLDGANAATIIALLRQVNSRGTTVLVISHDEAVASAADRVVRLADGRVVH